MSPAGVPDRDILAAGASAITGASAILGTRVALTVVGGEVVHQSEGVG